MNHRIANCAVLAEPLSPAGRPGLKPGGERLRYHGVHRQRDRDARSIAGAEKKAWHMIRLRIPLGTITAEQYLALDQLSERVTYNHSLRATAGQGLQLHGVPEEELADALDTLQRAGLAAGCNPDGLEYAVACPPAPLQQAAYQKLRQLGAELCGAFYPAPNQSATFPEHQPRKFTVGLALPGDNSANVFAQDIGLVLVDAEGPLSRVNVLVGGGLSMPGRRPGLYARIATPLGSVRRDAAVEVVRSITGIFRRRGQIAGRRFTRLKYVVDELGEAGLRRELEEQFNLRLDEWIPIGRFSCRSWHGLCEQGNGQMFYGIKVPNGRIADTGLVRCKTAFRAMVEAFRPTVIVTPAQDLILADLRPEEIKPLEEILASYHVPFGGQLTPLRTTVMACAGLPTCPLAVAESERVAEPLVRDLESELARAGRSGAPFTFRISGCSIGCIRPNMVDLGLVGRKPGHYDVFVGGDETSGRFGELYAEKVPLKQIISTVRPLLQHWGSHGYIGESFGNFYHRCFGDAEGKIRLESVHASPAQSRVEDAIRNAASQTPVFPAKTAAGNRIP